MGDSREKSAPPPLVVSSLFFARVTDVSSGIVMAASRFLLGCFLLTVYVSRTSSAPAPQDESPPMPYEYKYDVEDQEKTLYFGANEAGDAQGKVNGAYRVLLPDGRLMTVEYTVEGESGFVPKISFESNANPFGGK